MTQYIYNIVSYNELFYVMATLTVIAVMGSLIYLSKKEPEDENTEVKT